MQTGTFDPGDRECVGKRYHENCVATCVFDDGLMVFGLGDPVRKVKEGKKIEGGDREAVVIAHPIEMDRHLDELESGHSRGDFVEVGDVTYFHRGNRTMEWRVVDPDIERGSAMEAYRVNFSTSYLRDGIRFAREQYHSYNEN